MSTLRERYLSYKNRRPKDWWEATFADPLSWLVLAIVGEQRWITPNRLTLASFLCHLIPAYFIAFLDRSHMLAAALLLQLATVLDSMDGNLARHRGITTAYGGYLDRILDGAGFLIVCTALSWHVHLRGGEAYYLLLGPVSAAFYLLVCYMYWSVAYAEHTLFGHTKSVGAGKNIGSVADVPTIKYILGNQLRIVQFNHVDFFFWIGLALWLDKPHWVLWLLFLVTGAKALYRFITRPRYLLAHDREQAHKA